MAWLSEIISQRGIWIGLLAVFAGGLALNLTPCVYPMIPVTVAFFSQQASGARLHTVWLALLYVVGLSLSYAVLGALTASAGALFGSWLQHPAVLLAIAVGIVALALSMFGLYELRLPQVLTQRLGQVPAGAAGAFVMGTAVGFIAAPCIGPFVAGLVLLVVQRGSPWFGFVLFFTLGLGMGLPYLVLGMAAQQINRLPKAGPWLVWSKKALGIVLLGLALFFLKGLLPARAFSLGVMALLLAAGVYLGWLERTRAVSRRFTWSRRLVGVGLIVLSVAAWPRTPAAPLVAWAPYTEAAFEAAQRAQRPILIDVYADWCLPCVEMDHVTFRHPDVVLALSSVATLRLDVTDEVSEAGERLIRRHRVYGAPTILVFDRAGKERTKLRVLGFMTPAEFLEVLEQIL
ncbi:MAG: thioredoxin family protein [Candidatus Omnitrophica bacterium]|nr:thioredoxin family protein [Candidatus Omnitrophota bacterium]